MRAPRRSRHAAVGPEGYFEVKPSRERRFVVNSRDRNAPCVSHGHGPSGVGLSGANVAIAVREGSVNVSEQAKGTIADLTGGQQVRLSRTGSSVALSDVAADDIAAWRERRLVRLRRAHSPVVEQIARHTRAVVVFADSAHCRPAGDDDRRPATPRGGVADGRGAPVRQGDGDFASPHRDFRTVISAR